MSSASASPSPVQYKKFSHAQIREKVSKRGNVPLYFDLLMACAVKEDETGIVFDSFAPAWKKLVEKCEEADRKERIEKEKEKMNANASKVKINGNNANGGGGSTNNQNASNNQANIAVPSSPTSAAAVPVPVSPSPPPSSRNAALESDLAYERVLFDRLNRSEDSTLEALEKDKSIELDHSARMTFIQQLKALHFNNLNSTTAFIPLHHQTMDYLLELDRLRTNCRLFGIPDKYRARIWAKCLGVEFRPEDATASFAAFAASNAAQQSASAAATAATGSSASSASFTPLSPANLRVIRADIDRTLPHLDYFQRPELKYAMEYTLVQYCQTRSIHYKQGMNYILAPFFLLGVESVEFIQRLYSAFIDRFLASTFCDSEFGGLQSIFQLFSLLIAYHDPELSTYLSRHEIGSELYASSWFITLFVNRCRLEIVIFLWDHIVLEAQKERFMHYFISLAMLLAHRNELLKESVVMLPEVLSKLAIHSTQEALVLIQRAKMLYRSQTNREFMCILEKVATETIALDSPTFQSIFAMPAIPISASELVEHAYSSGSTTQLRLFILDCRSAVEFQAGHLPCSLHFQLEWLQDTNNDKLERTLDSISSMKGIHFALLNEDGIPLHSQLKVNGEANANGEIDRFAAAAPHSPSRSRWPLGDRFIQLIRLLIARGYKFVSFCDGGFQACHDIIMQKQEYELIDHHASRCKQCRKIKAAQAQALSQGQSGDAPATPLSPALAAFTATGQRWFDQMKRAIEGATKRDADSPTDGSPAGQLSASASAAADLELSLAAVALTPVTLAQRLTHSSMRDTATLDADYAAALSAAVNSLMVSAIDRLPNKEKIVFTSGKNAVSGVEIPAIIAVAMTQYAAEMLEQGAGSWKRLLQMEILTVESADQIPQLASSIAASSKPVIMFHPLIESFHIPAIRKLTDAITQEQQKLGQSSVAPILLLSLFLSRPAVTELASQPLGPMISLLSSSIEEYNGRLIPGCERIEKLQEKDRDQEVFRIR